MSGLKEKIWIMFLFICMLFLAGCEGGSEEKVVLEEVVVEEETVEQEEHHRIFIHVCGQISNPGVYELTAGSRVYEVIRMAGGMTDMAAQNYVNQAEVLQDGQKIYIPSEEEIENCPEESEVNMDLDERININLASKEELMTLNGIGDKRADAILVYRQNNGTFARVEDLMNVEGIKQGTYDKIKDQIRVE